MEYHEIHTSERKSFRGCRRRWDWYYRKGYKPHRSVKHFEFGIAFHHALETFFAPNTWNDPARDRLSDAVIAYVDITEQQKSEYIELNGGMDESFINEDYATRIDLGVQMLTHYALREHPLHDSWLRPVFVEVSFAVPIPKSGQALTEAQTLRASIPPSYNGRLITNATITPTPLELGDYITCSNSPACGQEHPNPAPLMYCGRCDLIVQNMQTGAYFIFDHKTASTIDTRATTEWFLDIDDQIASYVWALRSALGIDIRGFIYAEYLKDFPKAPIILKRKHNGKLLSTDKQQRTTFDIFRNTADQLDPDALEAGFYDDFLDYIDGPEKPVYHRRQTITKSLKQLDHTLQMIIMECEDMVDPNLHIYPNASKPSCSNCAFKDPCMAQTMGLNYTHALDTLYQQVGAVR